MAVTLAQARLNAADDIDRNVIDEFRRSSFLLDNMTFDQAVNAAGNGATMTYGYTRLVTPSGASFRAINSEYTSNEATKEQKTVDLKVLGGAFKIDRVLDAIAASAETAFQMAEKIKASANVFGDAVINGDKTSGDTNGWDGLNIALTSSSTEVTVGSGNTIDLTAVNTQALAFAAMAQLDNLISQIDGPVTALLMNRKCLYLLKSAARYASALSQIDGFGGSVATYDGIPLVDLGDIVAQSDGAATPIVKIASNQTSIYAVSMGLAGFHGVALAGQPLVRKWMPDFAHAGAVKAGEVELVCAPVLKRTRAAAVLRKVKVS